MISNQYLDNQESRARLLIKDLDEVNRLLRFYKKTSTRGTFINQDQFDVFVARIEKNKKRIVANLEEICELIPTKQLLTKILVDAHGRRN